MVLGFLLLLGFQGWVLVVVIQRGLKVLLIQVSYQVLIKVSGQEWEEQASEDLQLR